MLRVSPKKDSIFFIQNMKTADNFKELVGIIGGMGPEATNYLTSLLVRLRQPYAKRDQDHIPYLVYNNPQIPDRTEFILGQSSKNPLTELIYSGKLLKQMGATFLVMPCNTSHAFSEELEEKVGLEVMNMIHLTVKHIGYTLGQNVKVGLLATTGTVKANIYHRAFKRMTPKIKVLTPDSKVQKDVMKAIYGIKGNGVTKESVKLLKDAAKSLIEKGADVIILGCTEIPLALPSDNQKFIDPMVILAQNVIERCVSAKAEPQKGSKKFWNIFGNP